MACGMSQLSSACSGDPASSTHNLPSLKPSHLPPSTAAVLSYTARLVLLVGDLTVIKHINKTFPVMIIAVSRCAPGLVKPQCSPLQKTPLWDDRCFLVNLCHVSMNMDLSKRDPKSKSSYVLYRTAHLNKHLQWRSCLEYQFYLSFTAFLCLYQNTKWDCGRTQWKIILKKISVWKGCYMFLAQGSELENFKYVNNRKMLQKIIPITSATWLTLL